VGLYLNRYFLRKGSIASPADSAAESRRGMPSSKKLFRR